MEPNIKDTEQTEVSNEDQAIEDLADNLDLLHDWML